MNFRFDIFPRGIAFGDCDLRLKKVTELRLENKGKYHFSYSSHKNLESLEDYIMNESCSLKMKDDAQV